MRDIHYISQKLVVTQLDREVLLWLFPPPPAAMDLVNLLHSAPAHKTHIVVNCRRLLHILSIMHLVKFFATLNHSLSN
jgi:hypothetical protein